MTDQPRPLWGVPAYTGPDSPQSSVRLCPVCLHPAGSPEHYEAARIDGERARARRALDRKRARHDCTPPEEYPPCPPAGEHCNACGSDRGCNAPDPEH